MSVSEKIKEAHGLLTGSNYYLVTKGGEYILYRGDRGKGSRVTGTPSITSMLSNIRKIIGKSKPIDKRADKVEKFEKTIAGQDKIEEILTNNDHKVSGQNNWWQQN